MLRRTDEEKSRHLRLQIKFPKGLRYKIGTDGISLQPKAGLRQRTDEPQRLKPLADTPNDSLPKGRDFSKAMTRDLYARNSIFIGASFKLS